MSIPINAELIAMIPSKAEREYLTKIDWQFSDLQAAGMTKRGKRMKNG